MTNNSLSISIERRDIFYQNFNTGKNFYNFILAQQDDQTAPVPKLILYHHSFEKYIQYVFLVQKIIHAVEFKHPHENSIEKTPEIIDTVENNYRIIRWIYQHLYADIADMFFEYIHSLDPHEIQQLDGDIKTIGYCVINLLEIDNALELLSNFQLFYHNNGIWPVTKGLLIVPDREVQEGQEKINLKNLYEMFRYTKSRGLVSMQF